MSDSLFTRLLSVKTNATLSPNGSTAPARYAALRRNLLILMLTVSLVPLLVISLISHFEAKRAMQEEAFAPLKTLVNKTKHSFELFLAERKSAISFIASAYEFQFLADQNKFEKVFNIMTKEFGGFVDMGLIDDSGIQASYVGPYELKGKKYDEQEWFKEVMVKGEHISDVFLGYRRFPHFVIAVKHSTGTGRSWILRATINTDRFDDLILSMGLDPGGDAFVLNEKGVLQTKSRFFGGALSEFPLDFPAPRNEADTFSVTDESGREMLLFSALIPDTPFVLMMVKPRSVALRAWERLNDRMLAVLFMSLFVIVVTVYTVSTRMVSRIRTSDSKREAALRNMEHTEKLASIGRLAAGVAHEINNPMAIINEKAGLMEDLVAIQDIPQKDRFLQLTQSIIQSVERCSSITHRLLGFARHMDVKMEKVSVNEVIKDVLIFLEKEALHRSIKLRKNFAEDLPRIESDRGQLQQVFLNILNNAFEVVGDEGGEVCISTFQPDPSTVSVSIEDNGCGMSGEVKERLFEPFYTTKGADGTGLGLSITYGIVRKFGGSIDLESQEGIGTKFRLNFPLKQTTGEV